MDISRADGSVIIVADVNSSPAEKKLIQLEKTIEETAANSGVAQPLAWQLRGLCPECRVSGIDLGHDFVPHGSQQRLYEYCGLDAASIAQFVSGVLTDEK